MNLHDSEEVVGYVKPYRIPHPRPEPVEVGWSEVFSIIGQMVFVVFLWVAILYALPIVLEGTP